MQNSKNYPLVQWWMTAKFPLNHLNDKTSVVKKWFFHPIKRRLAKYYLLFLRRFTDIKVIAITGSSGKTTTKEMLAAILKLEGKTVWTKENIDPIYNIPTTVLKTPIGTKYLILEMGIEYPNEMDFYIWLAKPDVGIVINIFPTHLEFLKTIEGVFDEKIKLITNLPKNGIAILNSSDDKLKEAGERLRRKIYWFSNGFTPVKTNANAATSAARALGVSEAKISTGLEKYNAPDHRLKTFKLKSGVTILDDSYNSNPEAFLAAFDYFIKIAGSNKKGIVFGDMLELGDSDEFEHRRIGKKISKENINFVIGVGNSCKYMLDEIKQHNHKIKTIYAKNLDDAEAILKSLFKNRMFVLIKGSHSIHLHQLVDKLN